MGASRPVLAGLYADGRDRPASESSRRLWSWGHSQVFRRASRNRALAGKSLRSGFGSTISTITAETAPVIATTPASRHQSRLLGFPESSQTLLATIY